MARHRLGGVLGARRRDHLLRPHARGGGDRCGAGALHQHLQGVGITKEQLETIRDQTTPGTSVLFAVTDEGDLDRLGERSEGFKGHLVSTNLTGPERALLLETFD